MKKVFYIFILIAIVLSFSSKLLMPSPAENNDYSQELKEILKQSINVFIDCEFCDINYIKTQLNIVNFVRDKNLADVHIIITSQRSSNGRGYTIDYIGRGRFDGEKNRTVFFTYKMDTWDTIREKMVKSLKLGLVPYLSKTPVAKILSISFSIKGAEETTQPEDKWNYWVFNFGFDFAGRGESHRKREYLDFDFTANRVTESSKFMFNVSLSNFKRKFTIDSEEIKTETMSRSSSLLYVRSAGEHWSFGGWIDYMKSTYKNYDFYISISPAIEYNFFPYTQATRRQLRALYKIGPEFVKYNEETVYGKLKETLMKQSLSVILDLKEEWGSSSCSLSLSNYMHDFSKYHIGVSSGLFFRIFKGVSLELSGWYSKQKDQLNLPMGSASLEDVLLRLREMESNYFYGFQIGLNFTFGSIYTNIVNPRFGTGRRRHY